MYQSIRILQLVCPIYRSQFLVRRTSIVKTTFTRNSGERLAPETHFTAAFWKGPPACSGTAHSSSLSSLDNCQILCNRHKLLKCMWQASKDGIFGGRKCLVLVGWARKYTLESSQNGSETKLLGVSFNHDIPVIEN